MSDCQKAGREGTILLEATGSSVGKHLDHQLPPALYQDPCTKLLPSGNAGCSCCLRKINHHACSSAIRFPNKGEISARITALAFQI